MKINSKTDIFGIIGYPLGHTLSPAMHNAGFEAAGINAIYLSFQMKNIINIKYSLRQFGIKGLSVTIPHKIHIKRALDQIDPLAIQVGSVNTILWGKSGLLTGYTTDGLGAVDAIHNHGFKIEGKNILVIGSGGSARSIIFSLLKGKTGKIGILARNIHTTRSIVRGVRSLRKHPEIEIFYSNVKKSPKIQHKYEHLLNDPALISDYDLIIQTTPMGMQPVLHERRRHHDQHGHLLRRARDPVAARASFDDRDGPGAPPVVMINRTMAERWWQNGQDPLQSQLQIGRNPAIRQIVGVVDDVRERLWTKPRPIMYLPLAQIPDAEISFLLGNQPLAWIVRTSVDPATLSASIQSEVRAATRTPVIDVQPMTAILSGSIARQRLNMLLMALFGGAALLLAAVGIYGLVAFSVEQRTHEIGIRMALGARAERIRGMVLRQGLGLAAIGTGLGMAAAFFLAQILASNLFGVEPRDTLVFVTVPAVLALVAVAAVLIPAYRASRVDPLVALRHD